MANIQDYVDESGNPKSPQPQAEPEAAKPEAAEKPDEALPSEDVTEPVDDLPDKYKGKTPKEIARMHQEAEGLAGKHAQRLDELQRTLDALILQQGQNKPEEEKEEVDYFSDPEKAINANIESHPVVKELRQQINDLTGMTATQQLYTTHPDAAEVAKSEEFLNWVKAESGRKMMYAQASQDPVAAGMLISDFKASKPKPDNQKQEKARAKTGVTTSSSAPTSRKIYKSHDIRELMKKDPKRYQSMMPEIRQAYAEGRVR